MVAAHYGSVSLNDDQADARTSHAPRASPVKAALLAVSLTLLGISAVFFAQTAGTDDTAVMAAVDQVSDSPDCQCLGMCNTPDASHEGTWCYINSEIIPCMDSTHRVIYGQTWARCSVVYGDNDCEGNPCQNGAICVDKYDGHECVCRPGWSGSDCSTPVKVQYTISLTTSDLAGSDTTNSIFIQFTGSEGDTTHEEIVFLNGVGQSVRSQTDPSLDECNNCPTFMGSKFGDTPNPGYASTSLIMADVGTLHKVTYRVSGDDSLDLAALSVEFKGKTYVAVGELPPSENGAAVSVTVVEGRQYSLRFGAVDNPGWAATANDVYVQLTGAEWQVSGAVVALPSGIEDGCTCNVDFYAADVGIPSKITYWVRDDDSVLPTEVVVDGRYAAEVTQGERFYGSTGAFEGDDDTGKGYAFKDSTCAAGDTTDGCTGTEGARSCRLWDPDTSLNELLCPWVLPYSDGRYIIIDLVDTQTACVNTSGGNDVACNCGSASCAANEICSAATSTCSAAPACADTTGSTPSSAGFCECAGTSDTSYCLQDQLCTAANAGPTQCTWSACADTSGAAASTTEGCICANEICGLGEYCDSSANSGSGSCAEANCADLAGTQLTAARCTCYGSTSSATCEAQQICTVTANAGACTSPAQCSSTDGSTALSGMTAPCACGSAHCENTQTCTSASNLCTWPACANVVGGAASSVAGCTCGTETCGTGQLCTAASSSCTWPTCDVTDGSDITGNNAVGCQCGTATCTAGQDCFLSSATCSDPTVSGAPSITSVAAGDAQVVVTFAAPSSNGGAGISTYTITPGNSGSGTATSNSVAPVTITGLTNDQSYSFTITAENAVGTSASSAATAATPTAR